MCTVNWQCHKFNIFKLYEELQVDSPVFHDICGTVIIDSNTSFN